MARLTTREPAKVPLAGTSWIPGVTEGEILAEVRRLLEAKREQEIVHEGRARGGG